MFSSYFLVTTFNLIFEDVFHFYYVINHSNYNLTPYYNIIKISSTCHYILNLSTVIKKFSYYFTDNYFEDYISTSYQTDSNHNGNQFQPENNSYSQNVHFQQPTSQQQQQQQLSAQQCKSYSFI